MQDLFLFANTSLCFKCIISLGAISLLNRPTVDGV